MSGTTKTTNTIRLFSAGTAPVVLSSLVLAETRGFHGHKRLHMSLCLPSEASELPQLQRDNTSGPLFPRTVQLVFRILQIS